MLLRMEVRRLWKGGFPDCRPKDDGSRLLGLNQRIENCREAYGIGRRQESRLSTGLHGLRWLDRTLVYAAIAGESRWLSTNR